VGGGNVVVGDAVGGESGGLLTVGLLGIARTYQG
jgi:hypothetical protein